MVTREYAVKWMELHYHTEADLIAEFGDHTHYDLSALRSWMGY